MTQRKSCLFLLTALVLLTWGVHAHAANGSLLTGIGPVNASMSGAGTAAPLDSTAILTNPAGLVRVPNRVDMGFELGIPISEIDTSQAAVGNPIGAQKTEIEALPLPVISGSFAITDKLALGLGFFQMAGTTASYKHSRVNPAFTGDRYDKFFRYVVFKVVPAFSYAIRDNLSIGAGVHLNYGMLSTDSAVAPTFAENAGMARTEGNYGVGASVGVLYSPLPEFSLGLNYTTRQMFRKFKKYSDLVAHRLDLPRQVKLGIAGKPFSNWLLALDFLWIDWNDVSIYGKSPEEGGLGWRDQFVFDFGTQVTVWDMFHMRAGYGYGRSPVTNASAFANALAPAVIMEHNISIGFGFDLGKHWTTNVYYGFMLENKLTQEPGTSQISLATAGTHIESYIHAVALGLSYRWGEQGDQLAFK